MAPNLEKLSCDPPLAALVPKSSQFVRRYVEFASTWNSAVRSIWCERVSIDFRCDCKRIRIGQSASLSDRRIVSLMRRRSTSSFRVAFRPVSSAYMRSRLSIAKVRKCSMHLTAPPFEFHTVTKGQYLERPVDRQPLIAQIVGYPEREMGHMDQLST